MQMKHEKRFYYEAQNTNVADSLGVRIVPEKMKLTLHPVAQRMQLCSWMDYYTVIGNRKL